MFDGTTIRRGGKKHKQGKLQGLAFGQRMVVVGALGDIGPER